MADLFSITTPLIGVISSQNISHITRRDSPTGDLIRQILNSVTNQRSVLAEILATAAPAIPPGPVNPWLLGGNSFGVVGVLGTIDNFQLRLICHNVIALTIDNASQQVAIGIGIVAPASRLHVVEATSNAMRLESAGDSKVKLDFYSNTGLQGRVRGADAAGSPTMELGTAGNTSLLISDAGSTQLLTSSVADCGLVLAGTGGNIALITGLTAGGFNTVKVADASANNYLVISASTPPVAVLQLDSGVSGPFWKWNKDHTFTFPVTSFASLPAPANGSLIYCFNAKSVADGVVAGTVAVGGGTGCMLQYVGGAWLVM